MGITTPTKKTAPPQSKTGPGMPGKKRATGNDSAEETTEASAASQAVFANVSLMLSIVELLAVGPRGTARDPALRSGFPKVRRSVCGYARIVATIGRTCRLWQSAVLKESLWQSMCAKSFPHTSLLTGVASFRTLYRSMARPEYRHRQYVPHHAGRSSIPCALSLR